MSLLQILLAVVGNPDLPSVVTCQTRIFSGKSMALLGGGEHYGSACLWAPENQ